MNSHTHTKSLALWTGLWLVTTAIASFGPTLAWNGNVLLTGIAIAISVAAGWLMVKASIKHVLAQDEMQQRIALEAMGLTLGMTLIAGIGYSLLDTSNLIHNDAEITVLVIFMGLAYLANLLLAQRRYS